MNLMVMISTIFNVISTKEGIFKDIMEKYIYHKFCKKDVINCNIRYYNISCFYNKTCNINLLQGSEGI